MKKLALLVTFALTLITAPAFSEESYDPLNTLNALNYAIVSIYNVEREPFKTTVDKEYDSIISNLAIGNITADSELITLFTEMMNAYTENRLDEKDKAILEKQYEIQVNRAFLEVRSESQLKKEAFASTAANATQQITAGSWLQRAIGFAGALLSGGAELTMALQANDRLKQHARSQENEYMLQRMASEWELDKARIRRFNTLKTNLLSAAWLLLDRYKLPDEARLTEENLKQFYAFISEQDIPKALRMGKRLEENFALYPPFWVYLGNFYLQDGKQKEARDCFEKFEQVNRPIFRKDGFAAANARYKIYTLERDEQDEAARLLDIIEKQSPSDDWNSILFAALQNYQLGNREKAEDLLYRNIDNGHSVALNSEILRQIKNDALDLSAVQSVAIREFKEPGQLEKLAKSGSAEAQYTYGMSLYDKKQVLYWLEQAASQEHFYARCELAAREPEKYEKEAQALLEKLKAESESSPEAQFYLARFYAAGAGLPMDKQKAFQWYQKAAEQGYAWAQTNLGGCYYNGEGTAVDKQKAFQWYQKAAEQGDGRAQTNLGICYEHGSGTTVDKQKAFQWYQKAAEQGYAVAQTNLGFCYANGIGTTVDNQKAFQWYQKAAEQGYARAQTNLGVCYEYGTGTAVDKQKAFQLYQKAAEQGYARAQTNLGVFYEHGIGTTVDKQKAFQWYQKAAEQGDAWAQRNLGLCYEYGTGTTVDKQKAFQWYQKAAEQGDAWAQMCLGLCYHNGIGTTVDKQKAFQWYQKAAEQGVARAQNNLGACYEYGIGTTVDKQKAFQWYQRAAEQGNENAAKALKRL